MPPPAKGATPPHTPPTRGLQEMVTHLSDGSPWILLHRQSSVAVTGLASGGVGAIGNHCAMDSRYAQMLQPTG